MSFTHDGFINLSFSLSVFLLFSHIFCHFSRPDPDSLIDLETDTTTVSVVEEFDPLTDQSQEQNPPPTPHPLPEKSGKFYSDP